VKVIATNEAKLHLSSLLHEVERGETIVISRGRKPLAKLVPHDEAERVPRPKVGEMIDEPCHIPEEALRPMNEEELRAWWAI
jgi:prevent-host-death family protein